ncbi:calcium-binding protein, partial [Lutimaribacter marinistellae]
MASFYITGLSTSGRTLADGDYGYVGVNGALLVDTGTAIYSGAGTVDVVVDGRVFNDSDLHAAMWLISDEATVEIGPAGSVTSAHGNAIDIPVDYRATVVNFGTIRAAGAGIALSASDDAAYGYVTNTGLIDTRNHGIALDMEDGSAEVMNTGVVQSLSYGIYASYYSSNDEVMVTNTGVLSGLAGAYHGSGGTDIVVNTGQIFGDVILGAGNDTFDGREGTVTGKINGYLGDDLYIIDDASIVIDETLASNGNDTVESAASYVLGDTIEELTLLGADDLTGVGNDLSNRLRGNGGANVLDGEGGGDYIFGRGGSDTILGGDGDDYLSANSGWDRVYAEAGNDTILGGAGRDLIDGGEGQDRASYYNAQLTGVFASLQNPANNTGIAY